MRTQRLGLCLALLALLGFILAMASGCTSVSRGLGKITANKFADPRSGTVWLVPPPQVEPPSLENKTVYISFRNISDAQSVQLGDKMRNAAKEQGWTVVQDPQKAQYRLRATLRYFGEVKPESGGKQVADNMGLISGAAVGIGTGVAMTEATGSTGAGIAAGVGAGGLASVGISNASRPREWAMILDFILEEYNPEPVEFKLRRRTGAGTSRTAGATASRMTTSGGTQAKNTQSGTITKTSHYFPHGMRLSAWANQMNMNQDEALPHIRQRIGQVVTQVLPR